MGCAAGAQERCGAGARAKGSATRARTGEAKGVGEGDGAEAEAVSGPEAEVRGVEGALAHHRGPRRAPGRVVEGALLWRAPKRPTAQAAAEGAARVGGGSMT